MCFGFYIRKYCERQELCVFFCGEWDGCCLSVDCFTFNVGLLEIIPVLLKLLHVQVT